MTNLIERYLAAIARNLPSKQAADITAELRDVLLSRVEEQEAKLGRPMDRAELGQMLVDFGHPLVVAGRYRKVQHLIGPEVFPFWWAAVKVMLAIVAGVYLVLIILGVATNKTPVEFNKAVPSIWYVAVYLFGMITLVCMAIERYGKAQVLRRWKPANLPPATGKTRSTFELAFEAAWDVVFICWWIGLFRFRDFIQYPDFALQIDLAPVWAVWRWPIVGYCSLEIVVNLLEIARPSRIWTNSILSIVRYAVGIGVLLGVLQAGHWLAIGGAMHSSLALPQIQANFDLGMRIGIMITIAFMGLRIFLISWRLHRVRQAQASMSRALA